MFLISFCFLLMLITNSHILVEVMDLPYHPSCLRMSWMLRRLQSCPQSLPLNDADVTCSSLTPCTGCPRKLLPDFRWCLSGLLKARNTLLNKSKPQSLWSYCTDNTLTRIWGSKWIKYKYKSFVTTEIWSFFMKYFLFNINHFNTFRSFLWAFIICWVSCIALWMTRGLSVKVLFPNYHEHERPEDQFESAVNVITCVRQISGIY